MGQALPLPYHFGRSLYRINIFQVKSNDGTHWKIGETCGMGDTIKLVDDGLEHTVEMYYCI